MAHELGLMLDEVQKRLQQSQSLSKLEEAGALHALQVLTENAIGKAKVTLKSLDQAVPISGYDAFAQLGDLGYREDEPMGGHDPYSNSKGCAELVSSAYRKSFLKDAGIAMATVRAGNVIGGGDWALDRLIPDVLRALQEKQPVLIRNPHAIRPWQHVLEPLSGYLLLAERLYTTGQTDAEGWNFGPRDEDARTVQWIVEHLCEDWGDGASWTLQPGEHPHEANFLKLDISKARQRLQWTPRWSLETALKHITEWHQAWLSGQDMRSVCLNQINQYRADL